MKIAYLMLAHTHPHIISRAINVLSSGECEFFIHVDRKSRIEAFSSLAAANVFLLDDRVAVYWGGWSEVDATILLLREATKRGGYGYLVLMSGTDYPLRGGKYINRFFRENAGQEFVSSVRVPNEAAGKSLYDFNKKVFPQNRPLRRFVARALGKVGLAQRDHRGYLGSMIPYSGSQWWAMTNEASRYCLEFLDRHPRVRQFFKNAPAASEAIFQTVLCNSHFGPRVRANLVYDDWSVGVFHPAFIDDAHLDLFESQEKVVRNNIFGSGELLFARKIPGDNASLLDRMDRMIERKDSNSCR